LALAKTEIEKIDAQAAIREEEKKVSEGIRWAAREKLRNLKMEVEEGAHKMADAMLEGVSLTHTLTYTQFVFVARVRVRVRVRVCV
jgi:hypothetical protein